MGRSERGDYEVRQKSRRVRLERAKVRDEARTTGSSALGTVNSAPPKKTIHVHAARGEEALRGAPGSPEWCSDTKGLAPAHRPGKAPRGWAAQQRT